MRLCRRGPRGPVRLPEGIVYDHEKCWTVFMWLVGRSSDFIDDTVNEDDRASRALTALYVLSCPCRDAQLPIGRKRVLFVYEHYFANETTYNSVETELFLDFTDFKI